MMHKRTALQFLFGLAPLLAIAFSGCAGYQMGNQSLFPNDIHTIYVPMFQSDSFRPDLDKRLTEAVVKQIEEVTPYKVVSNPSQADSILSGIILADDKRVVTFNNYDDPQQLVNTMSIQVSLIDRRRGEVVLCEYVNMPEMMTNLSASTQMVPIRGQSDTTSQQIVIEQTAQHIVSLMESHW